MNDDNFSDAAQRLIRARQAATGTQLVDAPTIDYAPESLDDVYRIQAEVVAGVGPVGAWKTSAETAQSTPLGAPIFLSGVQPSGTTIPAGSMNLIGIEAELGFRLGADIPVTGAPLSEDEVAEAIDAIIPLIELVDTRLVDYNAAGDLWKLADNQINAGMILGTPITQWRDVTPESQSVTLSVSNAVIKESAGWAFPGTPLGLTTRFINTFRNHCGGIKAGHVITTGSMTGIDFIDAGNTVTADFPGLETVRVDIA